MADISDNSSPEYREVRFYFKEEALASLDAMKEAIGARSRADVIRQALECFTDKKMAEAQKED